MAAAFFLATIAAAGAFWVVYGLARKLRTSPAFHLASLGVGVVLYGITVTLLAVETNPEGLHFRLYAGALFGAVAWIPFVVLLVATWVRALGAAAEDGETSAERRIEDAAREFEAGHEGRAGRILAGVLNDEPEDPDAHVLMAEIHRRRGKSDLALGSLRLVYANAKSDEQFAKAVFKAAVILNEDLGRPADAARELDLIRKRMPGTPDAAKAQDWIVRLMSDAASSSSS